jgi:hypothetical protein
MLPFPALATQMIKIVDSANNESGNIHKKTKKNTDSSTVKKRI